MTQPARSSLPPEGRFTLALPEIRSVSTNSDNAIMISFTHEREALIEVDLVRVSLKDSGGSDRAVNRIPASENV